MCRIIVIGSLGVVPKRTERDFCSIIDVAVDKKEKIKSGRMANQTNSGLFECYINACAEIQNMYHVLEVYDDFTSLESSIIVNLDPLNDEMGYDMKVKEEWTKKV